MHPVHLTISVPPWKYASLRTGLSPLSILLIYQRFFAQALLRLKVERDFGTFSARADERGQFQQCTPMQKATRKPFSRKDLLRPTRLPRPPKVSAPSTGLGHGDEKVPVLQPVEGGGGPGGGGGHAGGRAAPAPGLHDLADGDPRPLAGRDGHVGRLAGPETPGDRRRRRDVRRPDAEP